MNIVSTKMVWISEKSNKYHSHEHCSGIQNAVKIELKEAEEKGYIPCRKCNN